MRAHLPNTSRRAVVARALALALAGSAALGLSACGSAGSTSPAMLLSDTFRSNKPIESGQITLSFTASPLGASASTHSFALRLQGPFQSLGAARLPRFALALSLTGGGHTFAAGATSTSGKLFIELAGSAFAVPSATFSALQQSYAQATRTSSSASSRSTFAALGIDPGEWLSHPRVEGTVNIAGAPTSHVSAQLNVAHFLADAERLSGAGSALGLGGGGELSLLSPSTIAGLSSAVRSSHVDLYTGTGDHQLRRLSLSATVVATPATRAIFGLGSEKLALVLGFAGVNQPQSITAPKNPRPISALLPALEGLGLAQGPATGA